MKHKLLALLAASGILLTACTSNPTSEAQIQNVSGGFIEQRITLPDTGFYAPLIFANEDGSVTLYGAQSAEVLYSAEGWQGGLLCYTVQPDGTVKEKSVPWDEELAQACSDMPRTLSLAANEAGTLYILASPKENMGGEDPFLLWQVENDQLQAIDVDFTDCELIPEGTDNSSVSCTLDGVSGEHLFVSANNMRWAIFGSDGSLENQYKEKITLPGQTESVFGASAVRNGYVWSGVNGYDVAYTLPEFESASKLKVPYGYIFPDWEGDGFYHLQAEYDQERIISHYTLTGDTQEVLMHGSDYTWGQNVVVKGCAAPDGTLWLLMETSGAQTLCRYEYDPDRTVENTLTVFSLENDDTVRQAINAWNAKHPETKIEYTVGMENAEQSGITEEDVVRQLNTQMLAGTSPDILILDGLSADSMIEQGMLQDLSTLADWSMVQENMLNAYCQDGAVYGIPMGYCAYLAGGRPDTVDDRLLTLDGLADAVEQMPDPQSDPANCCLSFSGSLYEQIFDQFYPASVNAIWGNNDFQEEQYKIFVEQINRIARRSGAETIHGYNERKAQEGNTSSTTGEELYALSGAGSLSDFWNGNGQWFADDFSSVQRFANFSELIRDDTGHLTGTTSGEVTLYSMPGLSDGGSFVPLCVAALPQGGENQQLAVEFLQTMLSDEVQTGGYLHGLPVTRNGLDGAIQRVQETDPFTVTNDLYSLLTSLKPTNIDQNLQQAAREAAAKVYDGELTIDEACQQVEQDVSLQIAEQ